MKDDPDIEWLTYRAAIDRAHKVAGGIGTKLLVEYMFAGRIRALIKLAVIEHPKSDREERRDWCPPSSFWDDWKGEQQSDDVPELGRFAAVRSVFNPSIRYDHFRTEAHGVKLCATDVDEWFPGDVAPQPDEPAQVASNGATSDPGDRQAVDNSETEAATATDQYVASDDKPQRFSRRRKEEPSVKALRKWLPFAKNTGLLLGGDKELPRARLHELFVDRCVKDNVKPPRISAFNKWMRLYYAGQWK